MHRIRTIPDAYKHVKELDPETSITPHFIRQMITEGQVPYLKAGKKYLVDVDALVEKIEQMLVTNSNDETPEKSLK